MKKDRSTRLATSIRKELAEMLSLGKIRELQYVTSLISITRVEVTQGYHHINVFISILGSDDKKQIIKILEHASSQIRGHLCKSLHLRFAPSISFKLDSSIAESQKISQLLDRLKAN